VRRGSVATFIKFVVAAITKYHRLGGLNRNVFSHSSRA
jgi:hypothetical protein